MCAASLDLLAPENDFFWIAKFTSKNSDASEVNAGMAPTCSGANRSMAGHPSRGKPHRQSGDRLGGLSMGRHCLPAV